MIKKLKESSQFEGFLHLWKKYKHLFFIKLGIKILILLVMFFTSCEEKLVKEVVEYHSQVGMVDSIPAVVNYYKMEDTTKVLVKQEKFYPTGKKEISGEFDENGKRKGHWSYWTEEGNLWSEGEFENGVRHGFGTVYYKDGGKYYEGESVEGKQNGTWKYWNEAGKLVKEVEFDMGKIISEKNL
jgi:antitoxin component YwqK of YwqJK toxin-antitoxin module